MIVENFLLDAFVTKPKQHQQGAVRFSEVQLHWLPVSYRIVFVYKAITARLPLTRALEGFFSTVQTCVLVDVNQPSPWFFTRWSREDSYPPSILEHSEEHVGVETVFALICYRI